MQRFAAPIAWLIGIVVSAPVSSRGQVNDVEGTPTAPFYSVASHGDTLFAGQNQTVYVSTDGGATWGATSVIDEDCTSVDAVIATGVGWFVGCIPEGVFRSVDQGATWTPLSGGLVGTGARHVTDLELHGTNLYASTDGSGVFRLDLSSLTAWEQFGGEFEQNEARTVVSLGLEGDRLFAAAGGNGLLFRRDLNEAVWTTTQLIGQILSVANTGLGVVAASSRRVWSSIDHGQSWQEASAVPTPGFQGVVATVDLDDHPDQVFLAVATDAGVSQLYRSTALDGDWEFLHTTSETLKMLAYGDRLYLAQGDGLRYMTIPPVIRTEPRGELPGRASLRLETPAPHPVVGAAQVHYRLDEPGEVRLEVFDVLGRKMTDLVDDIVPAGSQSVLWDTRGLRSGLYLLRLSRRAETDGKVVMVVGAGE